MSRNQQQTQPHPGDDEESYSSFEEEEEDDVPFIQFFCSLKGNEFFCEVESEWIADDFNLTGLSLIVPFFEEALALLLDADDPDQKLSEEQQRLVDSSAETLYGLIHARFILTPRGLKLMEEKYRQAAFGRCPRVSCGGHPVLPVGQSDVVRESSVKLYCPKCRELYFPKSARHKALDGAFWGTTFPHLLLLTLYDGPPPVEVLTQPYVPRIFGFRVRDPRAIAAQHSAADGSPMQPRIDENPQQPPQQQQQQPHHADPTAPNLAGSSGNTAGGAAGRTAGLSPALAARANATSPVATTSTTGSAGGGGAPTSSGSKLGVPGAQPQQPAAGGGVGNSPFLNARR